MYVILFHFEEIKVKYYMLYIVCVSIKIIVLLPLITNLIYRPVNVRYLFRLKLKKFVKEKNSGTEKN